MGGKRYTEEFQITTVGNINSAPPSLMAPNFLQRKFNMQKPNWVRVTESRTFALTNPGFIWPLY